MGSSTAGPKRNAQPHSISHEVLLVGDIGLGLLEDPLLPGATLGSLLRALAIGLVISVYASVRAYLMLLSRRRRP